MSALSQRFAEALAYAHETHDGHLRKGTDIPYVAHLLAVTALVLEHGGDEDTAIAALLHDAVEDQGGAPVLEEIRRTFGDRVARIVEACSDTDQTPKPSWKERKQAYINAVSHKAPDELLVSLADKVHNATAILDDYKELGDALWKRFSASGEETMWYYMELTRQFKGRTPDRLWQRLDTVVRDLHFRMEASHG